VQVAIQCQCESQREHLV